MIMELTTNRVQKTDGTYVITINCNNRGIEISERKFVDLKTTLDDLFVGADTYRAFNDFESFAIEFEYTNLTKAKLDYYTCKIAYEKLAYLLGEYFEDFMDWYY